jgi:hypothetical protein
MDKTKYLKSRKNDNGMVLVAILMISVFLSILAFAIINYSTINLSRARSRILLLQAQYASESGADATVAILNSGNVGYTGTGGDVEILNNAPHYKATYSVTVAPGANDKEKYITATGKVYAPADAATPKYTRQVEIFTQRSSTTASSSLVGRNIIYIESGVKNVEVKDLHVNGYIQMNKNTTNLIAENVVVGGRNTSAGNCSIGGVGNLVKPSVFTDPAQTKTNIKLAFNNCISPPGNVSNADFNVLSNQSDISDIQSTYIPWSQYMDASYLNSPGGCSDWTSGAFPRSIPSAGNSGRTHYPNTSSGVDTSGTCGTGGDLMLGNGQYNILSHAHIRANLCGSTGCEPIFYNPDNGLSGNPLAVKYIFVEGTAHFNELTTAADSGPIVFIINGADPTGMAVTCPYGGAAFLGNSGTSSAPAAYLLALNGVCISKTRFGSATALGGISGKNIYIDSNPATTFDLKMDPAFPTAEIPVDLSWRAVQYRRL